MGRTGTLASILLHLETKIPVNEIVFELRKRRHRSLVVESIVIAFYCRVKSLTDFLAPIQSYLPSLEPSTTPSKAMKTTETISPSMKGFLVTCFRNQESRAISEFYDFFNKVRCIA